MRRRALGGVIAGLFLLGVTAGVANAGQPGAECGDEGAEQSPPGFLTGGFENAEAQYAGSDGTASLLHANSTHAVSQYDIACVHYTAAHP
jgi:hypothetical protein